MNKIILIIGVMFCALSLQAQVYSSENQELDTVKTNIRKESYKSFTITVTEDYTVPVFSISKITSFCDGGIDNTITLPTPVDSIKGNVIEVTHLDTSASQGRTTTIETDGTSYHLYDNFTGDTLTFFNIYQSGQTVRFTLQEVEGVLRWVAVNLSPFVYGEKELTAVGKVRQSTTGDLSAYDSSVSGERKLQYQYTVNNVQEILSMKLRLGDRIKVKSTGAEYLVQADSVEFYTIDTVNVIPVNNKYAVKDFSKKNTFDSKEDFKKIAPILFTQVSNTELNITIDSKKYKSSTAIPDISSSDELKIFPIQIDSVSAKLTGENLAVYSERIDEFGASTPYNIIGGEIYTNSEFYSGKYNVTTITDQPSALLVRADTLVPNETYFISFYAKVNSGASITTNAALSNDPNPPLQSRTINNSNEYTRYEFQLDTFNNPSKEIRIGFNSFDSGDTLFVTKFQIEKDQVTFYKKTTNRTPAVNKIYFYPDFINDSGVIDLSNFIDGNKSSSNNISGKIINQAIQYCNRGNVCNVVKIPKGVYSITEPIVLKDGVKLKGEGLNFGQNSSNSFYTGTIFLGQLNDSTEYIINFGQSSPAVSAATGIENIFIKNRTSAKGAIYIRETWQSEFKNIRIQDLSPSDTMQHGIYYDRFGASNSFLNKFENIQISRVDTGFHYNAGATNTFNNLRTVECSVGWYKENGGIIAKEIYTENCKQGLLFLNDSISRKIVNIRGLYTEGSGISRSAITLENDYIHIQGASLFSNSNANTDTLLKIKNVPNFKLSSSAIFKTTPILIENTNTVTFENITSSGDIKNNIIATESQWERIEINGITVRESDVVTLNDLSRPKQILYPGNRGAIDARGTIINNGNALDFKGTIPGSSSWQKIIYDGYRYIAVARTGTERIATSSDAINWDTIQINISQDFRSIAYGAGIYVLIDASINNNIHVSYDLMNWTTLTNSFPSLFDVAFSDGKFIAVGDNVIITSDDGINWTSEPSPNSNNLVRIYKGGGFLVVTSSTPSLTENLIYSQDNGQTWTKSTLPLGRIPYPAYGKGYWLLGMDNNIILVTTDFQNYTQKTVNGNFIGCTYGDGIFVCLTENGTMVNSLDSLETSFEEIQIDTITDLRSFSFINETFIALDSDNSTVYSSIQNGNVDEFLLSKRENELRLNAPLSAPNIDTLQTQAQQFKANYTFTPFAYNRVDTLPIDTLWTPSLAITGALDSKTITGIEYTLDSQVTTRSTLVRLLKYTPSTNSYVAFGSASLTVGNSFVTNTPNQTINQGDIIYAEVTQAGDNVSGLTVSLKIE